jgi:hypothetical protein
MPHEFGRCQHILGVAGHLVETSLFLQLSIELVWQKPCTFDSLSRLDAKRSRLEQLRARTKIGSPIGLAHLNQW